MPLKRISEFLDLLGSRRGSGGAQLSLQEATVDQNRVGRHK